MRSVSSGLSKTLSKQSVMRVAFTMFLIALLLFFLVRWNKCTEGFGPLPSDMPVNKPNMGTIEEFSFVNTYQQLKNLLDAKN